MNNMKRSIALMAVFFAFQSAAHSGIRYESPQNKYLSVQTQYSTTGLSEALLELQDLLTTGRYAKKTVVNNASRRNRGTSTLYEKITPTSVLRATKRNKQLRGTVLKTVWKTEKKKVEKDTGYALSYDSSGQLQAYMRLPFGNIIHLYPNGMIKSCLFRYEKITSKNAYYLIEWDEFGRILNEEELFLKDGEICSQYHRI